MLENWVSNSYLILLFSRKIPTFSYFLMKIPTFSYFFDLSYYLTPWTRLNGPFCEATHTDTSLLDLGYHLPVAWFYSVFTLPDTDTDTDKNGFNYNMQNYSHWPTPTQTPILSVSVSVNTPLKSGWVVSLLAGELLLRAVFLVFSYIWRYY